MVPYFKASRLILALIIAISSVQSTFLPTTHAAVIRCEDVFKQKLEENYPNTNDVIAQMEQFAVENDLPTQIVEVGPQKAKRYLVGLDVTNNELMGKYRAKFNLETALAERTPGVVALEFAHETQGKYVTGALRRYADSEKPIYRWGREDITLNDWWQSWLKPGNNQTPKNKPIWGYSHIIGLSKAELENVKLYLEKPEERGPCKDNNCVAWTASIELGRTAKDATTEERKHLLNELGVARSMAHFEISRRLFNAANQRHTGIFVFYEGAEGLKAFNEKINEHIPALPQIPIETILRGQNVVRKDLSEAVKSIPDGAKVFLPIAAGASAEAVDAMIAHVKEMKNGIDLHVFTNGVSEATFQKGIQTADGKFRVTALFLGSNLRKLYKEGRVEVIPGYLRDLPLWIQDPNNPDFKYDVAIVRVSPPNAEGKYSLGPNSDIIQTLIESKKDLKIIAEVNPNVPFTKGTNFITEAQITSKFNSNTELVGPPIVPFTEVEAKIGENIAEVIEPNGYLQIGIGNVFGGVPQGLQTKGKGGLKIFTEMFGDAMKTIIENGSATEAKTGFAYGSPALYKWLNLNDKVEFQPTLQLNNPGTIANMPKFNAVNTALQVNLFGDVNATIGPDGKRMSSPGGQVEFMSGAARSEGGKAIIALRSTAKEGTISSIVIDLYKGPVTTPNESVTHVVTEYGIANLKGKTETQRAIALISIAHPKFQQDLITQAKERGLIRDADVAKIKLN